MDFSAASDSLIQIGRPDLSLVEKSGTGTNSQLRIKEALHRIHNRTPFRAFADGICAVSISEYLPLICTALHDGSTFPRQLEEHCLLSPAERRFEEDPHTQQLLEPLPIVLSGSESRYYYDLNRAPEQALNSFVFGRNTWRAGKHPAYCRALSRHASFYRLAGTLIEELIRQHGRCLVIDLHSYNGSKITRNTPLFNLGTAGVDVVRHRSLLDNLLHGLSGIELPGVTTRVAENDVFQGRGYFVNWVRKTFPEALPLCLEVKKVYCHERSGQLNPTLFLPLQRGLTKVIHNLYESYQREDHATQPVRPAATFHHLLVSPTEEHHYANRLSPGSPGAYRPRHRNQHPVDVRMLPPRSSGAGTATVRSLCAEQRGGRPDEGDHCGSRTEPAQLLAGSDRQCR